MPVASAIWPMRIPLSCRPTAKRDRAIFEFFLSTGCRVAELCSVKRSSIDFIDRSAVIYGKGGKYRKVFLSTACLYHMDAYLNSYELHSDYLFENKFKNKFSTRFIQLLLKDIGKACGISYLHPHLIRHTTATMLYSRGMQVAEIQKILGHKSIATTLIYAEIDDTLLHQHHQKIFG